MKIHIFILVQCVFWLLLPLQSVAAEKGLLNIDSAGLALQGYDPVTYFDGKPKPGKNEVTESYHGVQYRFVDQLNRRRFLKDPDRYQPAFGGWCGWAMLEGDLVEVDPERFKIIGDRIVLFYDGFWGDTLEKWNRLAGEKGGDLLFRQASDHYLSLKNRVQK